MRIWKKVRGIANKRVLLAVITIATLVSSLGGFFLWLGKEKETPSEQQEEVDYSKSEDYVVKEIEEGRIVENEKAGLSFKIPEGWGIEKPEYGTYIIMYSPDAIGTTMSEGGMEKGCEIVSQVIYVKTDIDILEKELKELHEKEGFVGDEYEIIKIDGHRGLRNITGIPAFNLYGASVHIPVEDLFKSKLYFVRVGSNLEDKERCIQEFEEFLKTVSIK